MTIGEKVYVPENSLQGQKISGHVVWNRDKKIFWRRKFVTFGGKGK